MKYTLVISENEEESPWEPLHVELGYKKEESTITLSFPNCYCQHIPYTSDSKGILRAVVDNMPRGMRYNLVITPTHAKNLAREGYDKEKIREYVLKNKLVSAARMRALQVIGPVKEQQNANNLVNIQAKDVPLIQDPRFFRIIVGGGPGAWLAHLVGGGATPGRKEIQKIELPKNWDKLVAKYKDMAPTYSRY